jgi:hypothetical protein
MRIAYTLKPLSFVRVLQAFAACHRPWDTKSDPSIELVCCANRVTVFSLRNYSLCGSQLTEKGHGEGGRGEEVSSPREGCEVWGEAVEEGAKWGRGVKGKKCRPAFKHD